MNKLPTLHAIGLAFVTLVLFVFIIVPLLTQVTQVNGVITVYPIFLIGIGMIAALFGSIAGLGVRAFIVFLIGYLFIDIIFPPLMVDMTTGIAGLTAQQQLMGDVFFFSLFTSIGLPTFVSFFATYILIPLALIIILIMEVGSKKISRRIVL